MVWLFTLHKLILLNRYGLKSIEDLDDTIAFGDVFKSRQLSYQLEFRI